MDRAINDGANDRSESERGMEECSIEGGKDSSECVRGKGAWVERSIEGGNDPIECETRGGLDRAFNRGRERSEREGERGAVAWIERSIEGGNDPSECERGE